MDEKSINWIAGGVLMILTFAATRGLDALLKLRAGNRDDVTFNDARITKGYDLALAAHAARILALEDALTSSRAEIAAARQAERDCQSRQSELSAQLAALQQEVKLLKSDSWVRRNQSSKDVG